MELLKDLVRFSLDILQHWQAYMTGGIVCAILTVYERMTTKTISRRIAVWGIFAFLVVAIFMTWRDQYRTDIQLQTKLDKLAMPDLQGSIDTVSASPSSVPGSTIVVITAHLKNLGAPSIAQFSGCDATTSSGKVFHGEFGPIPAQLGVIFGKPESNKDAEAMLYSREENLLIKATTAPIPTGGAVGGWLYVIFHGINENEVLQPGTSIFLTARDVHEKVLRLNYRITSSNTHKSFPQYLY